MRRTAADRRWYAQKRMSRAIDRLIRGDADAVVWVEAWRRAARLPLAEEVQAEDRD